MKTAGLKNHMVIRWDEVVDDENTPAREASLRTKTVLVGRIGLMMLSAGTGAWRVRNAMNTVCEALGMTCSVDIGLLSINYTCFEDGVTCSQTVCLVTTGVNTDKLDRMEAFVQNFRRTCPDLPVDKIYKKLDDIEKTPGNYTPLVQGLASGAACSAFTFLLGGGLFEMLFAFFGAFFGNWFKAELIKRKFTITLWVTASVFLACFVYAALYYAAVSFFSISELHQSGYICAMLFIIPGFPFITSGIDIAKLDMRSGLERLTYALLIIVFATATGWVTAIIFHLHPLDFSPLGLTAPELFLFRLLASFVGVFGFSIMFNSPVRMALSAALVGMVANTLRLELVDLAALPPATAAFIGAFCAGCLASILKKRTGYPRIAITVPSIVIMVPGLYLYKAFYNMGVMQAALSLSWFLQAFLIILALPLGLIAARLIIDKNFRTCT